jgi:hypothetical protein
MSHVKMIGLFDDPAGLDQARAELTSRGLAAEEDLRVEPDGDRTGERQESHRRLWERLKEWLDGRPEASDADVYAEGVRRGGLLLVVSVPEELAEQVRDVMRRNGAIELRRRLLRWRAEGWREFDPLGLPFTEEELVEEGRACVGEASAAVGQDLEPGGSPPRNIRLYDEATGWEIGRISEAELQVLRDALEEEGPDDNDYWINQEEIDDIACRPGATPHLVSLLRDALRNKPGGIDIAFQREEQPVERLRNRDAGKATDYRHPYAAGGAQSP